MKSHMLKKASVLWTLIGIMATLIAFQNCGGEFAANNSSSSGSASLSSESTLKSMTEDEKAMVSTMNHQEGLLYGSCSMQLNGDFYISHNGAIDNTGKKLVNVPEGNGGATWPVISCPNSGNSKTNAVKCAEGFKVVLSSFVQMDCRASDTSARCATYWATYNCAKISASRKVADDGSSGSGSGSGSSAPKQKSSSLKWVYTKIQACVGPTPAPAPQGKACAPAGLTASNECGTMTCQLTED